MRLGFHYHVPAIAKVDGIYMPGSLGRFIDSLASLCDKVICFLHSPNQYEADIMDYQIVSQNVHMVNIGIRSSTLKRTLRAKKYTSFMIPYESEMDILLVRGPSPLLPAMVSASPVPTALLLVGDYVAGVNDLPQPSWRREAIRLWTKWNKRAQTRAAIRSLTFVNSRVLYEELQPVISNLFEIRTTTLDEEDFFLRADTCQLGPPYRLLYVGRMDRGKGLLQIVKAVALVVERGHNVILDLVGWPVPGDPVLDEMQKLALQLGIADRVHYLGSRPLGPELFGCYRQADLFVIGSVASEGFPRTIWEAMAHSLPVIATRVGSIPAFIYGAAELVTPDKPDALAEAVEKLLHHPELRQAYILRGLELARSNTSAIQAGEMMSRMQTWLEAYHG